MWPLSAPPPDTFNTILITSLGEEMQASVRSHFYTILKPAQNKSPYLLSPPTRKGHHTKSAIKELTEHNTITFKTAVTHTQSKKRSYFKWQLGIKCSHYCTWAPQFPPPHFTLAPLQILSRDTLCLSCLSKTLLNLVLPYFPTSINFKNKLLKRLCFTYINFHPSHSSTLWCPVCCNTT